MYRKSDPTIIMTNKASEDLIAKLNMPIRYRRGGIIDTDSFLREKLFHETDLGNQIESEQKESNRPFWELKESVGLVQIFSLQEIIENSDALFMENQL